MKNSLLFCAAITTFISCQTYRPVELEPQEILNEISGIIPIDKFNELIDAIISKNSKITVYLLTIKTT